MMRQWTKGEAGFIAVVGLVVVGLGALSTGPSRDYALAIGCSLFVMSGLWAIASAIAARPRYKLDEDS